MDLFDDITPKFTRRIAGLPGESCQGYLEYLAKASLPGTIRDLLEKAASRPLTGLLARPSVPLPPFETMNDLATRLARDALVCVDGLGREDVARLATSGPTKSIALVTADTQSRSELAAVIPSSIPIILPSEAASGPLRDRVLIDAAQRIPIPDAMAILLRCDSAVFIRRGDGRPATPPSVAKNDPTLIAGRGLRRIPKPLWASGGSAWTLALAILKGAGQIVRVPAASRPPALAALRSELLGGQATAAFAEKDRSALRFTGVPGSTATEAGQSRSNAVEAEAVVDCLRRVEPEADVLVVSPYTAQNELLRRALKSVAPQARVCTPASVRGQTADYVVISMVDAVDSALPSRWDSDPAILATIIGAARKEVHVVAAPDWINGGCGGLGSPTSVLSRCLRQLGRRDTQRVAVVVDSQALANRLRPALAPEGIVFYFQPGIRLPGHPDDPREFSDLRSWLACGPAHCDRLCFATTAGEAGEATAWMVLMRIRTMGVTIDNGRIHRLDLDESADIAEYLAAIRAEEPAPLNAGRIRAGLCRFQALCDLAREEDAPVDPEQWAILRLLAAQASDTAGRHGIELVFDDNAESLSLRDGSSIFAPPWEGSLEEAREKVRQLSGARRSPPRRVALAQDLRQHAERLIQDPSILSGLMRLGPAGLRAMKPEPDAEPIPWKLVARQLPAPLRSLASIITQQLLTHAFAGNLVQVEKDDGVFLEGPTNARPSRLPDWRRAGGQRLVVNHAHLRLLDELGIEVSPAPLVPGELMETAAELQRVFADCVMPLAEDRRVDDSLRVLMQQAAFEIEGLVVAGLPAKIARNRNVRRNDAFRLWWLARQMAGLPAMTLAFDHPWHAHNARVLAALLKAGLAGLTWANQPGFSPQSMESALETGEADQATVLMAG